MSVKVIATLLAAIFGGIAGVFAAYFWYQSSRLPTSPPWADFEPVETEGKVGGLSASQFSTLEMLRNSATLNKKAALWTAASVLLSALSGIVGSLPSSR